MSLMAVKKKKKKKKQELGAQVHNDFEFSGGTGVYPICHKARWSTPWTAHPSDTQRQKTIHTHT